MILKVINHDFVYDMKNLCTVFFPWEKINDDGQDNITVITKADGNEYFVSCKLFDREVSKTHILSGSEDGATEMSVLLYNVLSEITGFKPPWGILFGVRPAKLMHRFVDEMGEEKARKYFIDEFLATAKKTDLALEVMKLFQSLSLFRFMFQFRFARVGALIALSFLILLNARISFLNRMLSFFVPNLKKRLKLQRNLI